MNICYQVLRSVPKIGSVITSLIAVNVFQGMKINMSNHKTFYREKQYTVLTSGIDKYPAMTWASIDPHVAGPV